MGGGELPCGVPPGRLQERFGPNTPVTVDKARMKVSRDGKKTKFHFSLSGLNHDAAPWVLTAWLVYPPPLVPAFASFVLPLAPSYAPFCSGLCRDPNTFKLKKRRRWANNASNGGNKYVLRTSIDFDVRYPGGHSMS